MTIMAHNPNTKDVKYESPKSEIFILDNEGVICTSDTNASAEDPIEGNKIDVFRSGVERPF